MFCGFLATEKKTVVWSQLLRYFSHLLCTVLAGFLSFCYVNYSSPPPLLVLG